MEMIRKRYCKWFDALDSVLGNRHNVTAAYTNESQMDNTSVSDGNKDNNKQKEPHNSAQRQLFITVDSGEDEEHSDPYSSSSSSATKNKGGTGERNSTNDTTSESPKKKTKTSTSEKKLSYLEAAGRRRLKKKSIVSKRNTGCSNEFSQRTSEHFDRMYNIHNEKLANQAMQQRRQLAIEDRKLKIEEEKMKQNDTLVKLKEEKLKTELMQSAIQYNFDVMKKRKEMTLLYPEMSSEEINALLPLRDV